MKLEFDFYKRGRYFGVNIWYPSEKSLDPSREYLEESQYDRIAKWCNRVYHTQDYPNRARRMAFADFWFRSKKDLNWFVLYWGSVDSANV